MKNMTFIGMLILPLGLFINNWLPWLLFLIGVSASSCEGKGNYLNPWGIILSSLAITPLLVPFIAKWFKQISRIVVNPASKITEQEIDDALRRSAERQATLADEQILQYAIASGVLKVPKGKKVSTSVKRAVIIEGDAEDTLIVTGDGNICFQFKGPQSENLIEKLTEALANSQRLKKEPTLKQLWMLFPGRVLMLLVFLLFVLMIGLGFVPPRNPVPVIRISSIGCVSVGQGMVVGPHATIKGDFTGDLRSGQSIMVYGQRAYKIGDEYPWKLFGIATAENGAWELENLPVGDAAFYSDLHARIEVVVACNADSRSELWAADLSLLAKNIVVSPQVIDFNVVNPQLTLTRVNNVPAYNGMPVAAKGCISGTVVGNIPTGSKVVAYIRRNVGGGSQWEPAGSDNPVAGIWNIVNINFRSPGNPDQTVAEIAALVMPDNCEESDQYQNLDQFKLMSVIAPPPVLQITRHSVNGAFEVAGSAENILEEEERICVRITGGELAGRKCFLAQGGSAWAMTDIPSNRVRNALSYLIEVTVTDGQDCCDYGNFVALAQARVAGPGQPQQDFFPQGGSKKRKR